MTVRVGLIGARGHTGGELVRLIDRHPQLTLACAASRSLAGRSVSEHFAVDTPLRFEQLTPQSLCERELEAVVLALPNGESPAWVASLEAGSGGREQRPLVVDLSADHRFDDDWYYGLPELTAGRYRGERRIANPGCYATAMQLAIAPFRGRLVHAPSCFGVSGYSGAGTRPSRRNDSEVLRDNLLPYALAGHLHEREVSRQLNLAVAFCPHVASFFRGICLTATLWLDEPLSAEEALRLCTAFYADAPLVEVSGEIPEVRAVAGRPGAIVGGFAADLAARRLSVVCVLDNLLKGAAVQAVQNLNTGLGLPGLEGLTEVTAS